MLTYSEIIEKLKDIISKEQGNKKIFDKDVALALDIAHGTLRQQKHKNTPIPYPEVMQFLAIRNISINWFFFNQLPESLIENTSNYILLKYQKNITASAGGGAINYDLTSSSIILDKQFLDYINSSYKYTEVLKVFGDSMEPNIKDDSLIFVDTSKTNITKSGSYVINTNDGLFIKEIEIKKSHYNLKSANSNYKDIKINELNIIGKVTGYLTKV